jgi:4-hydroxybenzoate polyprenyltransferase
MSAINSQLMQKLTALSDLIRLQKQYGTLLLLFPALWSLFVAADGFPPWSLMLVFIIGSFLMRSAGCVINDIVDRNLDRHVWRTQSRPIASGRLTTREAFGVFLVLIGLAAPLAFVLNPLAMLLAPIGLLLAVIYPFTKRLISLPQAVLGIAFGWGALMAWAAIRNDIGLPALLIFIATIFWATAYDTIYALMDKEDDLRIGIKSSAILFGQSTWWAVGLNYFLGLGCMALVGYYTSLGWIYYLGLMIGCMIFAYHTYRIKKGVDREQAFVFFKSNVMVGLIVLLGIFLDLR